MTPWTELNDSQKRQYIDAESVFTAIEQAQQEVSAVRGSMFWRGQEGRRYLIRTSSVGAQKSLGADSAETRRIFDDFSQRKAIAQGRLRSLRAQLSAQVRMNRALRVGRVPAIVVDTLAALADAGVHEHFLVVGTHALYAYETACGVRVAPDATATRDIDLLFDTRKRLSFATQLRRSHRSLLALLRKADKTFSVRRDQLQTIVNADGFEVDIIRRIAKDGDPHPLRMSDDESDVWAVQVGLGDKLLSCRRFDQVVVSTTGAMARMATVHPLDFVATKRALAQRPERDPLKRSKDKLQAAVVEELVNEYLPQLGPPRITISPEKCYFAETSVKSRTIRSIGYDGPSQVLEVEYPSGDVYRYSGVPAAEVEALLAANSIGAYVNSHIKVYPFEKKFAPSFHEGEDPGFS